MPDYIYEYDQKAIAYLSSKDKALGAAIAAIGPVEREVFPDLFTALVNSIVAQQISAKALETIWSRMTEGLGAITPERICAIDADALQRFGITMKKAVFIKEAASQVLAGHLDIDQLQHLDDDAIRTKLCALNGVGAWTAEMLMIFSLQRPDILSWNDLAIHRGMRMLYRHRTITKALFEKYRRRYSPYATVASLYIWAVSAGACEGLADPAQLRRKK